MTTPSNPPVVIPGGSSSGNNILINPLQRGNPVLEHVRHVGKEFADIVADYQVGKTTGVLFLSLKYHRLHPEYIHNRVEKLGDSFTLRILLIISDITEHKDPIRELTKTCLVNNVTIIVAFSAEEAGHYLSTFKQFEHKPPDMIKERTEKDYYPLLRTALTSINKVNKTDVETLRTSFGSLAGISTATTEQLQNLPGFGNVKVKNIKNAFEKPLRSQGNRSLGTMPHRGKKDKGKARAMDVDPDVEIVQKRGIASGSGLSTEERPRPSSPEWDIEQELPPLPEGPFSIELDLN